MVIYGMFYAVGLAWVLPGLIVAYIVCVLGLDSQHTKAVPNVELAHDKRKPLNWLEQRAGAFWKKHFDYFPVRPWGGGHGVEAMGVVVGVETWG